MPDHFQVLGSQALSEVTHVNAVYEIPENKNSTSISAFQKGNFIVTTLAEPLLILSADLKNIIWISKKEYVAHDVQVLENGNLLLFHNRVDGRMGDNSNILEINPRDESVVWSYGGKPKIEAPQFGSVNHKNGLFILTGNPNLKTITVVNRAGDVLESFTPKIPSFPNPLGFFHVQFLDHDGFLKNKM